MRIINSNQLTWVCHNVSCEQPRLGIWFMECFTNTFLHTHSWLNWVEEDDWWWWGWIERKAKNTIYIKKTTSKWVQKHRECGKNTLFPTTWTMPLSGYADLGTGRVVTPWRVMGGVNSIPRRTTYHETVGFIEPQFKDSTPFYAGKANDNI